MLTHRTNAESGTATADRLASTAGPTIRDLAAIEAEWPSIEADMAALDAEIRTLAAAESVNELDVRRVRRARRVTLRSAIARPSLGGEAA